MSQGPIVGPFLALILTQLLQSSIRPVWHTLRIKSRIWTWASYLTCIRTGSDRDDSHSLEEKEKFLSRGSGLSAGSPMTLTNPTTCSSQLSKGFNSSLSLSVTLAFMDDIALYRLTKTRGQLWEVSSLVVPPACPPNSLHGDFKCCGPPS